MGKKQGEKLWELLINGEVGPRWGCAIAGVLFIIVLFLMLVVVR